LSIPGFTIPRVDMSRKKSGNELAQYVRHEFRDSNPLWICSPTSGSARANPVNIVKPVPRLLAPVSRIARAVSSLLF
jgi:hypothetical protein